MDSSEIVTARLGDDVRLSRDDLEWLVGEYEAIVLRTESMRRVSARDLDFDAMAPALGLVTAAGEGLEDAAI